MEERTKVRQGEGSRRTVIVLIVSTLIAGITAILGFFYVEGSPREELDDPLVIDAEVDGAADDETTDPDQEGTSG